MSGDRLAEKFDQCLRIALLGLVGFGLAGCATTANLRLADIHSNAPIKILLLQSPIAIDPARLHRVLAPAAKPGSTESEQAIAHGRDHAQAYALAAMRAALAKQPQLLTLSSPRAAHSLIDAIRNSKFGSAIPQPEADRIEADTGADALLRFGITDYGLTPKSWRDGYIAFEVSSTLAFAGLIASAGTSAAKAAAGAYLAQETVEETAEAYAGFWALDAVSRPIRLEAELILLHPVGEVWQANDTGLSQTRLSRPTRKVGPRERSRQLDQATEDAVKEVSSELARALGQAKSIRHSSSARS